MHTPIWVQQFYIRWGFYPMAGGTLGDGSAWDETNPVDATIASTLDDYDRDIRIGVRGRMALEHEWPSSQAATSQAGVHKFITLQNQASKPTVSGTQLAAIYTKTVGAGLQEAFFENEAGTEVQITDRAGLLSNLGAILQITSTAVTAVSSGTTILPIDNSIPQTGEGNAVFSLTITPKTATSIIYGFGAVIAAVQANNDDVGVAAFKNTTANAIIAVAQRVVDSKAFTIPFFFSNSPGTTAATTYYIRAGANTTSLCTLNGTNGTRIFGGVAGSTLYLAEVK